MNDGKVVSLDGAFRQKSNDEGLRLDGIFFRDNPHRLYRVRRSVTHEFGFADNYNMTIVYRDLAAGYVYTQGVNAKIDLPDNDQFLAAVWRHFEKRLSDGGIAHLDADTYEEMKMSSGFSGTGL